MGLELRTFLEQGGKNATAIRTYMKIKTANSALGMSQYKTLE